jgi:DNA replication protein DnaC
MVALIGGRGTGKTQIGVEAIRETCKRIAKPCLYTRAADVFIAVRECYRKDATRRESEVIRDYTLPHLVVFDELHERSESDAENRLLTLILDKRYAECKPTILIGNLLPGEGKDSLRHNIGESIFDRMVETGGFIECNWQSFRVKEGA